MFRKKNICTVFLCILSLFFTLIFYFVYSINNNNIKSEVKSTTEYSIETVEHEIKIKVLNLPSKYKRIQILNDPIIKNFQRNVVPNGKAFKFNDLWGEFDKQVNEKQIFNSNNTNLGNVIQALKTAAILHADVYSKGTQLKLLLQLEGNHLAVFKPQWYNKEKIILGHVYAGKDRTSSEILAFYLSAILDLRLVPIVAERSLNIKKEVLPVATNVLNSTQFDYKDKICIFGKCHYCKREDPVCTNDEGGITGVVIYYIPGKFLTYNSPWQRTYKKGKRAVWETHPNYCATIKSKISIKRLLDLIDVSIFDFLIQNGDRHHYEVVYDKVILLDNGKGLGNPYVHHLDILAPLYQCCSLRRSTWDRLQLLSGGVLSEILKSFPEVKDVVWTPHFNALDERLQMIFATVEICKTRNEFVLY